MSTSSSKTVVAIVAPSGYAPEPSALALATTRLETFGCEVRNFYDTGLKHQRFGGTDAARLAQLHAAAADPAVQVVFALRGGYGLSRLLPEIDFGMLAASSKLFVGHSDFTALQMGLLACAGAPSFAGPMICADFSRPDLSDYTMEQFWRCLRGPACAIEFESKAPLDIDVSGTLWGGNLTMLAHLAGSRYLPAIEDGILFIEDVNEHPYRIERLLLQMLHGGALRQRAILFGDFSGYRLAEYDNGYDLDTMLDYLRDRIDVPILTGLPFGHIRDKATLAIGSRARVSARGHTVTLAMSDYPTLTPAI